MTEKPNNGYILVSTIWVLAFLSIGAAAIAEWYGRSLSLVADRVDSARGRAEELSTRATLLYEIATGDLGVSGVFLGPRQELAEEAAAPTGDFGAPVRPGIPDVIFDGMPYRGVGDALFSVQDESGLWGLLPGTPPQIRDLLLSRGIEYERADILAARLADYVDSDDLVRIGGAEATDYRFAGLEPPSNRGLESVFELKKVMGWAELDEFWGDEDFVATLTLAWYGAPNPAVAPPQVLRQLPGAEEELIDSLIASRRQEDFQDEDLTQWITELTENQALTVQARPYYSVRMRFWRAGERQFREYSIKFTLGDQEPAPWTIENNYYRPITRDLDREPATTSQLPAFVL